MRGRYLGVCSDPVLDHLLALGVTAVALMPVFHSVSEPSLLRRGLTNYWGYSPVGSFAPDARFASGALGEQVAEFREMVRRLHAAGLEVIVDAVYGHSPEEGGPQGSAFALRGLDNAGTFRLDPRDPSRDDDVTGCGNTLDARKPFVHELVLDSLRFWASDMHVDGFRLDQAVTLGRAGEGGFSRDAPLLRAIAADPVLSRMKLVAEPWDIAAYELGHFPRGWGEWNDRYRDGVRTFWRGDSGRLGELARRITGSRDVFGYARRVPLAGTVNYIASHDGFTLADLVSYSRPHDEGNLGSDGTYHDQKSSNWGVEGLDGVPPRVLARRRRALRSFLATLALSEGVPMLGHGDEMGRTQRGNGNAYCHDDELTWVDWDLDANRRELLKFARHAFRVRRGHRALRVRPPDEDMSWLHPLGHEMTHDDWDDPESRAFGLLMRDAKHGGDLLWLINANRHLLRFELPAPPRGSTWREILHGTRNRLGPVTRTWTNVAATSFVLLSSRE